MAKLDKSQQRYACDRIDQMASDAVRKLQMDTKIKSATNDEVKALLEKKGFTVTDKYNLASYVQPALTAKQVAANKKLADAATAKRVSIKAAAQEAKDQVMLGDSEEVTKLLADFAKKIGV